MKPKASLSLLKNSVLFSWVISYMIILIICAAISAIVYFKSESIVASEVNRANDALLGQLRQNVDSEIDGVVRLGTQISLNLKIQKLIEIKSNPTEAQKLMEPMTLPSYSN